MTDWQALAAPFPPEVIHWRVGATNKDKAKGLALAYLNARDVQKRLDAVCGVENWQQKYRDVGGGKLTCELLIRIGDEWVGKSDGAGATDIEAEKGAFSDAFKRAAVSWGIGRYLYDLKSPWVNLDGRNIDKKELPRLQSLLKGDDYEKSAQDRTEKSRDWANRTMMWMEEATLEQLEEWWVSERTQRSMAWITDHWRGKVKDLHSQLMMRHRGEVIDPKTGEVTEAP